MKQRIFAKKAVVVVLAPAAASIAAIGLGAQPAYADQSGSSPWTYTDGAGGTHNCTVTYELLFPFGSDPDALVAATDVTGDSGCTSSNASVRATYLQNSDGTKVTNIANGGGGSATAQLHGVKNARIETEHTVFFNGCATNCVAGPFSLSKAK
jgi:hypothetical protein